MGSARRKMISDPAKVDTRKTRAQTLERRSATFFWSFLALNGVVYLLHEHTQLISLEVARWSFGISLLLVWVFTWWMRKLVDLKCAVCGFETARSKWNHCPGCTTEIDLTLSEEKITAQKRWLSDQTLGNLYASDTTRVHVKRSKRTMYAAMAIFVLLVFLPMPLYFVGPFVQDLAPHWYWFFFGGMAPFCLVMLWQKLKGVRCVNCRTRYDDLEQTAIAHPSKRRSTNWRYCAYCVYPIDKSKR
jgi:hypothetical protein